MDRNLATNEPTGATTLGKQAAFEFLLALIRAIRGSLINSAGWAIDSLAE